MACKHYILPRVTISHVNFRVFGAPLLITNVRPCGPTLLKSSVIGSVRPKVTENGLPGIVLKIKLMCFNPLAHIRTLQKMIQECWILEKS